MFEGIAVGKVGIGEAYNLVQDAQGIPHASIAFLGDDMKGRLLSIDVFFCGNLIQMSGNISRGDAFEIKNLTPGKDGGQDLVFFRSGKDENRMGRRLFQGFQKCIECIGTEHVHLINDVYFVFACLWSKADLFNQVTDVINRIIARSI